MVTGIRVNETGLRLRPSSPLSPSPFWKSFHVHTKNGIWQANGFLSRNFYPLFQNHF